MNKTQLTPPFQRMSGKKSVVGYDEMKLKSPYYMYK